jgi:CheY-like chemotaxis protein
VSLILVVEDDPQVRLLLDGVLSRAGHTVMLAGSGGEALDVLTLQRPDLVTIDILMPTMNGLELYQSIRSTPATRDLPVVFVTALPRTHPQVPEDGFVVFKPFSPSTLIGQIEAVLAQSTAGGRPGVHVG